MQRINKYARWVLTVVTVGFVVLFIIDNSSQFSDTIEVIESAGQQRWLFLLLVSCYVLSWVILSAQFFIPLRRLGAKIGFAENVALVISGALLNYTPFKAGLIYRFHYIRDRHDISYGALTGLQLMRMIATISVSGLVGLVVLFYQFFATGQYDASLFVLAGIMLFAGVVPFTVVFFDFQRLTGPFGQFFQDFALGVIGMWGSRSEAFSQMGLIICQFMVLLVQYSIIFHFLNLQVSFLVYIVLIPLITILSLVSITPGNLGLRELVVATALSIFTQSFESGMFVGLMDRGVLLVTTILFGALSLLYLSTFGQVRLTD